MAPSVPFPPEFLQYLVSTGRGIGVGLAFLDRDGRFLFVSDSLAAMNGVPAEEHLGRTVAEVVPALWEQVADVQRRVLGGEAVKFELEGITPAAPCTRRWEEYWTPVRFDGEVIGIVATVIDVTELHDARSLQQELAARQATLRGIANLALSDAPMGEVMDAAIAAVRRHLEVPMVRVMRVVPGSDRLAVHGEVGWDPVLVAANQPGPRRGSFAQYVLAAQSPAQFTGRETGGRFRYPPLFEQHGIRSGVAVRITSGDAPWGVLAGYDTRDRVFDSGVLGFMEELSAILGLMVHERDSRTFREEVLSMASHQMRTPLTSVIGLAQHVQRRIRQGRVESVGELAESLVAEAFRLDEVLTQWNELAAAESYREVFASDEVDVAEVVAARVEQFRGRHDGWRVNDDYAAPVPAIRSDARRIGEIVDNLLENAVKYGGGGVEVSVQPGPGGVTVHCRDHGPGVPPEIAPFIFDRFFRGAATASHSGMGLGLYISRKLAEGLGGTLDVASTPGEGACFTLSLPYERRGPDVSPLDAALDSPVPL